mmetsp:Transcript_45515/g.128757  ORF Transcript_45515/g.128757 Transcript_45515/m.128757 type:complete len:258 (+) Transcript_45515:268-1041(+)
MGNMPGRLRRRARPGRCRQQLVELRGAGLPDAGSGEGGPHLGHDRAGVGQGEVHKKWLVHGDAVLLRARPAVLHQGRELVDVQVQVHRLPGADPQARGGLGVRQAGPQDARAVPAVAVLLRRLHGRELRGHPDKSPAHEGRRHLRVRRVRAPQLGERDVEGGRCALGRGGGPALRGRGSRQVPGRDGGERQALHERLGEGEARQVLGLLRLYCEGRPRRAHRPPAPPDAPVAVHRPERLHHQLPQAERHEADDVRLG